MDDLLNETIERINEDFCSKFQDGTKEYVKNCIQKKDKKELIFINEKILVPYLNYILENKKLVLLQYKKGSVFKCEETFKKLNDSIFIPITTIFGIEQSIQKYFIRYFRDGIMSIIIGWLENDCKEPINKIIEIIYACTGIEKV